MRYLDSRWNSFVDCIFYFWFHATFFLTFISVVIIVTADVSPTTCIFSSHRLGFFNPDWFQLFHSETFKIQIFSLFIQNFLKSPSYVENENLVCYSFSPEPSNPWITRLRREEIPDIPTKYAYEFKLSTSNPFLGFD